MKITFTYSFIALFSCFIFETYGAKTETVVPQEVLYVCTDYTVAGLFTGGIEGPAVDLKGNLYAVNFSNDGTIGIVDADGVAKKFADLPVGSIGNGIRFDKFGNMYIADYPKHNILIIPSGSTTPAVYANSASFNQPNDLAIMSNGILFASDPKWDNGTGKLWRIGKDKVPVLLASNLGTTNGVEVSTDEKRLYIGESVQLKIWKYDLNEKGEISNRTLFKSFTDFGLDGMRCDIDGNLYVTRYGKGSVAIFSPTGVLLHEVFTTGKNPSNIAFGGIDGRTCFVTLQDRGIIETFRTETPGREWKLAQVTDIFNSKSNIQIVYPNPASTNFYVSNVPLNSIISVLGIDGKIAESKKTTSNMVLFDVHNWKHGLYVINIVSNQTVTQEKIVID